MNSRAAAMVQANKASANSGEPKQGSASELATSDAPLAPKPYRAMLAICSDLDETPDAETYFELMRFLNTTEDTSMGQGVGLEVGNTIYFDMPPGHFSYWNASEADREKIRILIRSGHIDCLHSFGDLATTRAHAARALEELERHSCRMKVWVDHARAVTNFGEDIMHGHGDEMGHPAYHADLTIAHGVRYIWRGRVTSMIGQDRGLSLRGIANWSHPIDSLRTVSKEAAKQLFGALRMRKYRVQAGNRLLAEGCQLRDGQSVPEFMRCNPHWAGVSRGDRGDGIQRVLTRRFLDRLVLRGGYSILYTHLGKLGRNGHPLSFAPEAVEAFRLLAEYHHSGRICVTTTSRLLDHHAGAEQRERWTQPWAKLDYPDLG